MKEIKKAHRPCEIFAGYRDTKVVTPPSKARNKTDLSYQFDKYCNRLHSI